MDSKNGYEVINDNSNDNSNGPNKPKKKPSNKLFIVLAFLCVLLGINLITVLAVRSSSEERAELIEASKDEGHAEELGMSITGDNTVSHEYAGVTSIVVDVPNTEVKITKKVGTTEKLLAELKSKNDVSDYEFSLSGGKLSIDYTGKKTNLKKGDELTIYLVAGGNPKLGRLNVSTISGDMEIEAFELDELRAESVSGKVEVSDMEVQSVDIETVSGKIEIDDVNARTYNIGSASGKIEGDEIFAENEGSFGTVSGDIKFESIVAPVFKAESVSGEIKASGILAETVDVTNTSGRVNLKFSGEDKRNIKVDTVSGACELYFDKGSAINYNGSGKIDISDDLQISYGGDDGTSIDFSSISGRLYLKSN